MAIDRCKYSFPKLSRKVLPDYMRQMRVAIRKPVALRGLGQAGVGPAVLLDRMRKQFKHLENTADFPGCYVLISPRRVPFYVGISRKVASRIIQHLKGTHYVASLAYRMACHRFPHNDQPGVAMGKPQFRKAFRDAKAYLSQCSVAVVRIDNALERYLFEPYCAMKLNTSKWNTFETH